MLKFALSCWLSAEDERQTETAVRSTSITPKAVFLHRDNARRSGRSDGSDATVVV